MPYSDIAKFPLLAIPVFVLAGMFRAAVSGSGPADTETLTSIFVLGMEKSGYPKPF